MEKKDKQLWTQYQVTWEFHGNLFSSVPKNDEVVEDWLNSRKPKARPPDSRTIQEIQEEVVSTMLKEETLDEVEERISLGFQFDGTSLVVRGDTIRAHLKECAKTVGQSFVGKIEKEPMLGLKFTRGVYVKEYWLPIQRLNGDLATEPDGIADVFVHAQSRSGPVNALKKIDFVSQVQLHFTLMALTGIALSDIETVMQYGAIHGYAGERSRAEGRYVFTVQKIEN